MLIENRAGAVSAGGIRDDKYCEYNCLHFALRKRNCESGRQRAHSAMEKVSELKASFSLTSEAKALPSPRQRLSFT